MDVIVRSILSSSICFQKKYIIIRKSVTDSYSEKRRDYSAHFFREILIQHKSYSLYFHKNPIIIDTIE